jgi:hypothetical protein
MSNKLDVGVWSKPRNTSPFAQERPRVVVLFRGRLGNQMFQRAFGLALKTKGYNVYYNTGWCQNDYSLDYFENLSFISAVEPVVSEERMVYNPDYLSPVEPCSLMGYWQTEKYFKDIESQVRQIFKFKPPRSASALTHWASQIKNAPSAFVHIRHQDYKNLSRLHVVQPLDYYKKGVELIQKTYPATKIFAFSDDPSWCRENLPSDFFIIEGTDKFEDLQLMSLCNHAVIANSSFSWWGAWLGDFQSERIVIAPEKWFGTDEMSSQDIVPERWIKL